MPKTLEQANKLARRYKGEQRDYGGEIEVKYYLDKKHYIPAKLNCELLQIVIGKAVIIECKH